MTNTIILLIFVRWRSINQLRLYHLIKYSLRYDSDNTDNRLCDFVSILRLVIYFSYPPKRACINSSFANNWLRLKNEIIFVISVFLHSHFVHHSSLNLKYSWSCRWQSYHCQLLINIDSCSCIQLTGTYKYIFHN